MKSKPDPYLNSEQSLDRRVGFLFTVFFGLVTIVTVAAVFILFYISTNEMKKDMSTLADLIGINCAAPILFDDQNAAQDILSAFHAIPRIKAPIPA